MNRLAFAVLCASLAFAASAGTAATGGPETGIDILGPPLIGNHPWSGDRMRGARERLKDILPGGRF